LGGDEHRDHLGAQGAALTGQAGTVDFDMKPRLTLLLTALLALALPVCLADAPSKTTATLKGDPARPEAAHWLRSELYFGIGQADDPEEGLREIQWQAFVDKEVTPRFPDGLTVFDAYGQWRPRGSVVPNRLRSKVLVILYEDTEANRAAIDAIRVAYKSGRHEQSVLLVTEPVEVSF